jgi:hypothetical protein
LTRRYSASAAEVWAALVESDSRGRWLGDVPANARAVEEGRVLELELDLGDSLASIEGTAEGDATTLVLDHVRIPAAVGMRFLRNWTAALDRFEREVRS